MDYRSHPKQDRVDLVNSCRKCCMPRCREEIWHMDLEVGRDMVSQDYLLKLPRECKNAMLMIWSMRRVLPRITIFIILHFAGKLYKRGS